MYNQVFFKTGSDNKFLFNASKTLILVTKIDWNYTFAHFGYSGYYSQLTLTCSKSTRGALETIGPTGTLRCFYCKLGTYFTLFSSVPIADIEQANVGCVARRPT